MSRIASPDNSTRTGALGGRGDAAVLGAVLLLLAILLAATWQRWTNPIIDHGREMNLPTRILGGEVLYRDVQFLYGPFAPYFNALLYRLCGVQLATLHASGIVCAALILSLCYWLARQLLNPLEAGLATGLVLVVCALKCTGNYIQPYAYAAVYGLVFALAGLACAMRHVRDGRARWLLLAGLAAGLAAVCKLELAVPVGGAVAVALAPNRFRGRRTLLRAVGLFLAPLAAVAGPTYAWVLSRVPWRTLVSDNYVLFLNVPPQLVYYNRQVLGLTSGKAVVGSLVAAVGTILLASGLCAWIGAATSKTKPGRARAATLAGLGLWAASSLLLGLRGDPKPLQSAPLVLVILIAFQVWRSRRDKVTQLPPFERALLVMAAFALFSIARGLFNVSTNSPYTPFFVPVVILVYVFLLLRRVPDWLLDSEGARANARRVAMVLIAVAIACIGATTVRRYRDSNTYEIRTERGRLLTTRELGPPLAAATRFVEAHTRPDEPVLVLPQGSGINFLTARRYPLRQEIVHPGFLEGAHLTEALRRILDQRVGLILIDNILTPEMRDRAFGVDYNQDLMAWIEARYQLRATFSAGPPVAARLGDRGFFILAYARR